MNVLAWQDDEERPALLPILEGLTGATSYYDATAVREGEDGWILCWYGRTSTESDEWFQRCIRVNAGPGGWVVLPWCPNSEYPTTWEVIFYPSSEGECRCLTERNFLAEWEAEGGPYGRWRMATTACDDIDFQITWTPNDSGEGATEWAMAFFVDGLPVADVYFKDIICGFLPNIEDVDLRGTGICEEMEFSVVCTPFIE